MQTCDHCNKKMWHATGYWTDNRRWCQCRNCEHWQLEAPPQGLKIPPKILYLDIEVALMSVYTYDLYVPSKRLRPPNIKTRKFVICWAAAWLNPKTHKITGGILSDVIRPKEIKKQNDKRICASIFDLMESADIICGHNSNSFDLKTLKWRFMVHGMGFPFQYKTLDTFTLAGRETRPESRGLEDLSLQLGGRAKMGLNLDEWREIVEYGTPRLLAKSDKYCRGDVREGVRIFKQYADAIEAGGGVLYR